MLKIAKEFIMSSDPVIREIRRKTRKHFTAERKIEIVLEGLRGEIPTTDLCRREGISPANYYKWSKSFLEAGKNGLTKDTKRSATDDEVRQLKSENNDLKKIVAELSLEVQRRKKSLGL